MVAQEKRQRAARTPEPGGCSCVHESRQAFWSARSPLPLSPRLVRFMRTTTTRIEILLTFLFFVTAALQREQLHAAPVSSTNHDYWAVEDPNERAKLPMYKTIPAARPEELTPANGYPKPETFLTWHRSHGDNGGMRYSALNQIDRQNVAKLQQAWIYHSGDGSSQIQCNPIVVRGIMIAPTPGNFMVGIDAGSGKELWRFKPEGRP